MNEINGVATGSPRRIAVCFHSVRSVARVASLQRQPSNHYATLGLDRRCTDGQIRDAYRVLARKFHPDLNPGSSEAVARTQELNAAYEALNDPQSRRAYDQTLAEREKATKSARSTKPQQTIQQDIYLRLEEFFRGASLEVRVNDPGNPEGPEVYRLEIPPDTAPGTRFRVCREGAFSGGVVRVRVRAQPDFRFKVRGADLRCDLRISTSRAAQGGTESVRGPLGNYLRVQIPRGVARGDVIRIEGEGLPRPRGGRGDLLVRIVYTPVVRIARVR